MYLTCTVFYSGDWFYSDLIRKWHLCDYSMYAGICVCVVTLLSNIFRISCLFFIKSDRGEDIKLSSSYKWLNRGKKCYLSTISNPTEEKAQAWAHPSTGIKESQQRDFKIKSHQASLVLMFTDWFGSPHPNPWKLTVGCFLLCLNNIHLQDRWHIWHYISLHDCHYNLEFLALGGCTNEERLCVPFFQYIPCYTEVAKQLLYYSVIQSCSLLACPWWEKRRKRLGLSFPATLVCIQDCMLLSWSEIK